MKTTLVDRYCEDAFNLNVEMYRADWQDETKKPEEPLKFKPYRQLERFPLETPVALTLGDTRSAIIQSERSANGNAQQPLDSAKLSALLYYSYGVNRHELGPAAIWPFHRVVPSPRCFFPVELYCSLPKIDDIPAGVYYYDPAHHALIRLREQTHLDFISSALGTCNSKATANFLLTCHFWKNAFFYRNYTYRLCPQEVGILAGNVMTVAGACGLTSRVHHQFLDSPLNKLLGIEIPDESVMAVVSLYGEEPDIGLSSEHTAEELKATISTIVPTFVSTSRYDGSCCRRIEETHAVTMCHQTSDFFAPVQSFPTPENNSKKSSVEAPPDKEPTIDLAEVLRQRSSGMWCFNAAPTELAVEHFWRTIRYILSPNPSDVVEEGFPPLVDCYIAVNKVQSIESGIYRLHASGETLETLKSGPVAAALQSSHQLRPPQINYDLTNFVVFLVVDRLTAAATFGNRWHRIVGQEAGIVAQRLVTMCSAVNLTGRVHNGYKGQYMTDFLGLDGERYVPLFQILVGSARPTARFQMPISF